MKSLFTPLLLTIQFSLLFELIALYIGELAMAIAVRVMILLLILCIYYLRGRLEKHADDMTLLLRVLAAQDLLMALLLRGLFNLYSALAIYVPVLVFVRLQHWEALTALREQALREVAALIERIRPSSSSSPVLAIV
jgi:hypothetical protein